MFTGNRMVVVGAGSVKHDDLVRLAEKHFGSAPVAAQHIRVEPANFIGSDIRVRYDDMPLAHVAFGFPVAGWKDADNFPLLVRRGCVAAVVSLLS